MRGHVLSILLVLLFGLWAGEFAGRAATADALTSAGSTVMPLTIGDDTTAVRTGAR